MMCYPVMSPGGAAGAATAAGGGVMYCPVVMAPQVIQPAAAPQPAANGPLRRPMFNPNRVGRNDNGQAGADKE